MVGEIDGDVETIQLHFPGLERSDLSLRSEEGVLFVGVNGRERPFQPRPMSNPASSKLRSMKTCSRSSFHETAPIEPRTARAWFEMGQP